MTALVACQAPPRVVATGPFPGAGAMLRRPDGQTTRPQEAVWSFTVTGAACEARASGRSIGLALRVAGDRSLRMTLSGSARAPRTLQGGTALIAFVGPEGAWTLAGRRGTGHAVLVSLPLDETSVSQARTVLAGGHLKLASGEAAPLLAIPDAGVAGRDWFGCIRSKLTG